MTDNPYWLVSGLSYEDTLKLASADCVENFQRDAQSGETKFWPGSAEVYFHLLRDTDPFKTPVTRGDNPEWLRRPPEAA